MKLKRPTLIALACIIPSVSPAADSANISGHTNLVGTIRFMEMESAEYKRSIPTLILDRAMIVDGQNGGTRQQLFVTLKMEKMSWAPTLPVLEEDADPFKAWTGRKVRIIGFFEPLKRKNVPLFRVTSIEAEK
jgi:hypothetical protein